MTSKNLKISVLSYFYIAVVLDGLQRLSGLFVIELLKTNTVSHQNAAAPFIFSWAVANIVASFSDILIDKKYSGFVITFGVLLSATGAALCILDTTITTVIVFWGFIFGSGYGLASPHLSKNLKNTDSSKVPFYMQITSSLGISIMPFILYILIPEYGLQGSYLIFSGMILQYLPLAVAAGYNIRINIPNIKWRVRKKSSQYSVSKQKESKTTSIESFTNSLEPDLILNINHCDENCYKSNKETPTLLSKEVLPIGRKRSETRGSDLCGLEIDRKMFQKHFQVDYQINENDEIVSELMNDNGRNGKAFEKSFSKMDIIDDEKEYKGFKNTKIIYPDMAHKMSMKTLLNTEKHDLHFKDKILLGISEYEKNDNLNENGEIRGHCFENKVVNGKCLTDSYIESTLSITDKRKNSNKLQSDEIPKIKNTHSFISKHAESKSHLSQNFQGGKLHDKENEKLSTYSLPNKPLLTIPLDIKVYVEECTFTNDGKCRSESCGTNISEVQINGSIKYSSPIFLNKHERLNYDSRNNLTHFDEYKRNLSKIYSISENCILDDKKIAAKKEVAQQTNNKNRVKLKLVRVLKFLNRIISPACLGIVLITIIYETSLITLLTMFGDFGTKVDQNCSDFTWILVAFGAGGLIGKLCCCKISKTIPEKSHAISVVLFLLTGLGTAGVLYSPNLNWLAGFYCILGALEGGITYSIPKLILEYTHKDSHHMISSIKNLLSGTAIFFLPYIIGLFPDELGDYEFLLQTLSCSSILCAFIAYFIPYLRSTADKGLSMSFEDKIQTV